MMGVNVAAGVFSAAELFSVAEIVFWSFTTGFICGAAVILLVIIVGSTEPKNEGADYEYTE